MDISFSADRARKLKQWQLNQDFTDGAAAVRYRALDYVARKKALPVEDYNAIMDSTEMFPMAARTMQSFVGLVFRQQAIFDGSDFFPEAISVEGYSPERMARAAFVRYMVSNDGGILIDTPDTPAGATEGDLAKLNFYAYQTLYPAQAIKDIEFQTINGQSRLVYVRLVEDAKHGRELRLVNGIYQATVWYEVDGKWVSETIVPQIAGKPLDYIPFVWLNDGESGAAMDDLCDTNRTHFNKSFYLSQAEAWVSAPVMVIAGVEDDVELDFTPGAFWRFDNSDVQYGFSEYKGDGVPLIERTLDRLEQHGSMLGSRMLIQEKSVSEAEGTVARRQAGENSILASMARHVSAKLTEAFRIQGEMMGKARDAIAYNLSTNFIPAVVDPAVIGQLIALVQGGLMPFEAFFEALQKMEIAHESWDYETWAATVDIEKGTRGNVNG